MDELSSRAKNTRLAYLSAFDKVAAAWDMTPEEMFEQRMGDLRSEDPRDGVKMEKKINKLMQKMSEAGVSAEGCKMIKKATSSFFAAQEIPLKFKRDNGTKKQSSGQKAISRKQVQELIRLNGYRNLEKNTALFNVLNDSGLRVGDVAKLTVGQYRDADIFTNEEGEQFKAYDPLVTQKCGIIAHVHIGPESVRAVDAYLAHRKEKGETLTPDSTIFLDRSGRPYTERRLSNTISTICTSRGLKRISAHSFRKRHKTRLEKLMPLDWVLMLEGKTHSEYSKPDEETHELTRTYMRHYNALRINGAEQPTLTQQQNQELENLKAQVEALTTLIKDFTDQNPQATLTRINPQEYTRIHKLEQQVENSIFNPDIHQLKTTKPKETPETQED